MIGDRSGLFGLGTSGEGCDAEDLALPGVQGQLADALPATGTPVVLLVVSGRPYALGAHAGRAAAAGQAFFPGEGTRTPFPRTEVRDALVANATSEKVHDLMAGSPNQLLDSLF